MHSVLRMEKKFSTMALSKRFPRLDMDGVMPYSLVRLRYLLIPYSRLISFWLLPAAICFLTSSLKAAGYCFIPFLPDMETPPDVVLFSYIRGLLVYCPFLLVRFITNRLIISFGLTLPFLEKSQVCVASRFCQLKLPPLFHSVCFSYLHDFCHPLFLPFSRKTYRKFFDIWEDFRTPFSFVPAVPLLSAYERCATFHDYYRIEVYTLFALTVTVFLTLSTAVAIKTII